MTIDSFIFIIYLYAIVIIQCPHWPKKGRVPCPTCFKLGPCFLTLHKIVPLSLVLLQCAGLIDDCCTWHQCKKAVSWRANVRNVFSPCHLYQLSSLISITPFVYFRLIKVNSLWWILVFLQTIRVKHNSCWFFDLIFKERWPYHLGQLLNFCCCFIIML